ncbi:MAG: hypothetical protein AAGA96_04810 [Verrucomicrobiota bacterium]
MSTLEEIEEAIEKLPPEKVFELGDWIQQRIDDQWDSQIESDAKAGRLDDIAAKATAAHRAGDSRDFPGK